MKKIFVLLSTLVLIISLSVSSLAFDFPQPTNDLFVNDFAGVISEENESEIMKIGADLYTQTGAQIVVVTINSLDGYDVDEYALELGREWGVGSKDDNNGVVLLLSVSDRAVSIQAGYGLEGCVTDVKSGMILDEYALPYFSDDNFSTGLFEAYKAITAVVCMEYGVELDPNYKINYYQTYESNTSDDMEDLIGGMIIVVVIISLIVVLSGGFSGNNSNHGGGSYHGSGRSYRGGTYYGGFSSGSRGGFSGGGGGFRGGGGSFGGGGASRRF